MKRLLNIALVSVLSLGFVSSGWAEKEAPVRRDGFPMVRVTVDSQDQIDQIRRMGGEIMNCRIGVGTLDVVLPPASMAQIQKMGIKHRVLTENVQQLIDAERARLSRPQNDPRLLVACDAAWFNDFKSHAQINAKLTELAAHASGTASLLTIGTSLEGRTISGLRISGDATAKPGVFFNGCQHAREWISPMVNMYLADYLICNYGVDPTVTALVDATEIFIVPVVNPDGYEYSRTTNRMWRKNRRVNAGSSCRGVDLNRNWNSDWNGGQSTSISPCSDIYVGTAPFSEPETAAIRDFVLAHPLISMHIDYHSYGQMILEPWSYTSIQWPQHALTNLLGQLMSDDILGVHGEYYLHGNGTAGGATYLASGVMPDWTAEQGIFGYTLELRDTGLYGFILPANQIIPTAEENLPAALRMIDWAANPVQISYPSGRPTLLTAGAPTNFTVNIDAISGPAVDPATAKLYSRVLPGGTFSPSFMTPLGGSSYQATLPAVASGQTVEFYCSAQTVAGAFVYSPSDAPSTVFTAGVAELIASENMNTNPGWSTSGQWAWGLPIGAGGQHGGPDPTSGYTGSTVMGYNLLGDYPNNMSETHLTTPAFDCSNHTGVTLRFRRWLGVEQPAYDHAYVRVSNDNVNWTTVWQNGAEVADAAWSLQEFDISSVADHQATVYIRWTLGTTDTSWQYCGWNIDDVEIIGVGPTPVLCLGDITPAGGNGTVNIDDLVAVLNAFGPCTGCPADITPAGGNGTVNIDDLVAVLNAFGACP